ncbi:putative drug exporter of the RND superfamily [Streptomyces sp. 3213]|uniref:MMPL family transporter n=1 Tax=Streptomyces sp. 3213.3 TaxID=1855348 RepID=UPI00089AC0EA|nr:MMPL family transporter [Streptomyces sp. 3213.3]SEC24822.1 putative drug exporter of the RND superfamily [Streptomyces sp. 3213] [Streptomyces sp. 3213.3]
MVERGMTVRIARWSATHPWRAICGWVLFVVVCVGVGAVAGTKSSDSAMSPGESGRAVEIVDSGQFHDPAMENVLISARSGALDAVAARRAAADVAARLGALPGVAKVEPAVTAPNRSALLVRVEMTGARTDAGPRVQPLLDATAATAKAYPGLRVEEVGDASMDEALDGRIKDDFHQAELISIPVTLLILLVAFGAVIAAGVPVLLALSSVGAAIGLSALASHLVPTTDVLNSVVLLVGMAVGVDYSLFYLKREREERAKGRGTIDAVEIAAATSGHAVVVSGLAVAVAMSGMYLADDATFHSLATGSIPVVTVAVLGSVTVLPALLAKLGHRLDRPRVPLVWRLTTRKEGEGRFWPTVLRPALRAPKPTLAIAVVGLLTLAAPALGMTLRLTDDADLPRSIPIMQSYDRLTGTFPSTGSSLRIAVRAPAKDADHVRKALTDLGRRTQAEPLFAHDQPPQRQTSADRTVSVLDVGVQYPVGSGKAAKALGELRQRLVPSALSGLPGARYAVGGPIATNADFTADVSGAMPWTIAFVLVLTFVVLLATFRAPVIALTAIVLNSLSAGAAYGLLTLVFQHHWAEGLLGFRSNGGIVTWLPLFLFVVLFGLSMDYHVFVVSRIQEAVRAGVPTRKAVARGITGSASTVTSAAVVMVAVFSIFGTLTTLDLKQLGVGLATAILLDATIIRAVVLPAAMILLGRWNWWRPRPLRREPDATVEQPGIVPVGVDVAPRNDDDRVESR